MTNMTNMNDLTNILTNFACLVRFDGKSTNYACLVKFDGKSTNYACLVKFDRVMMKKNTQIHKKVHYTNL